VIHLYPQCYAEPFPGFSTAKAADEGEDGAG
jgi:hypothetical protein